MQVKWGLRLKNSSHKCLFVAVFLGYKQYWPGGFMVLGFYIQEHPKAQQAVVLILKSLRRRGNGLKSRPTDWEKPQILFKPCSLAITSTVRVILCPGAPEGSIGSGSGFKGSQKSGPQL